MIRAIEKEQSLLELSTIDISKKAHYQGYRWDSIKESQLSEHSQCCIHVSQKYCGLIAYLIIDDHGKAWFHNQLKHPFLAQYYCTVQQFFLVDVNRKTLVLPTTWQ